MRIKSIFSVPVILAMAFFLSCGSSGDDNYTAEEATLYVSIKGSNRDGNGTPKKPYRTIQHAIENAPSNHKIYVAAGTYNETILLKYSVSLYGGFNTNDWSDRNNRDRENPKYRTHIKAKRYWAITNMTTDPDTGYPINRYITKETIVDGFSITGNTSVQTRHGAAEWSWGIVLAGNGSPSIMNNTINAGEGGNNSSAIDASNESSPVIANNIIYSGEAPGLCFGMRLTTETVSKPRVYNNIIIAGKGISDTTATGIMITKACAEIYNNTIILGSSEEAYGIWEPPFYGGSLVIENNIICSISEESTDKRSGIYSLTLDGFPVSVKNNNIFNCPDALYYQKMPKPGRTITDIDLSLIHI